MRGDEALARVIGEQIKTQREYARWQLLFARVLAWVGLRALAHRQRHEARLAVRMAVKMQRGLATGAYLLGGRQFPYVEDQCGCARYCHPSGPFRDSTADDGACTA